MRSRRTGGRGVRREIGQYFLTSLLVLVVSLLCIPVAPIIGYRAVSLILLMVVLILPLSFDRGQVLVASGTAALAWNFFFIPPVYTFAIGFVEDVIYWTVFLVVAIVAGTLAGRLRTREQHAKALFALTKDLSAARSQQEVLRAAATHLASFFRTEVAIFLGEPDGDIMPNPHPLSTWFPDKSESQVAMWAYWNERKAGRGTGHRPEADGLYVPMSGPRNPIGVIGIRHRAESFSHSLDTSLAENFVTQIGFAIERELLNDLSKNAILAAETERIYQTIFNSISHELRTPLAAILGATENIQRADRDRLDALANVHVTEIRRAAERLDRLVANLLDISRFESGTLRPRADWTDLRDVVMAALRELTPDLEGRKVAAHIPDSLPLLKLDFGLLQQAIVNVIHNAVVHTPPTCEIAVSARIEGECTVLSIADNGPGIPPAELSKVFEKFYRSRTTTSGGIGLGLPIARGFVEVQQGRISFRNREGGGTECLIALPLPRNIEQP